MKRLTVPSTETYMAAHGGDRLAVEEIVDFRARLERRMRRSRTWLLGCVVFQMVVIALAATTESRFGRIALAWQLVMLVASTAVWATLCERYRGGPWVHATVIVREEPTE